MTDLASLILAVDSTQVKTGTSALDGLTAAGGRAETSVTGVARAAKATGASAASLAAQAQASARAAVGMASGLGAVGTSSKLAAYQAQNLAFQINDVVTGIATGQAPLRVFAQQSGQIYQIMQQSGLGVRGFASALLQMVGVLKVTRNAELAEEAANAAGAATAVQAAASRAAGAIAAADTELALAQAAVRVATTSEAETAAQVQVAAAHEAVAAAAAQAAIAEDALAAASKRAGEAATASAAATTVALGPIAAILAGVAVAAGLVAAVFKDFQAQVRDSGALDRYANSLGLTNKEMKELRQEVGGLSSKEMKDLDARARAFGVTWGDVFHGLAKTASDALDLSPAWQNFKAGVRDAFETALKGAAGTAAAMYGYWVGTYRTIVDQWKSLPSAFGSAFASAVNIAIDALNGLVKKGVDLLNGFIDQANNLPFVNIAHAAFAPVQHIAGEAGKAAGKSFSQNVADATAEAQGAIAKNVATIWENIIGAAEKRIKGAADTIIEDRTPKKAKNPRKQSDHGLTDALAELDAQIRGQQRLAAAYLVSDAAVIKAEALQKAEEQAIRHKGQVGIFYEKELALAVAQRTAESSKVVADLRFETETRKRLNDAVASGAVSQAEATQGLQLENLLRPLQAAYAVAEGEAKNRLAAVIRDLTAAQAANNAETAREQALRQIADNDNDIERLKLEKTLIGASNRERAVAIAQMEALQKLRDMPGLSADDQQRFVKSATDRANAAIMSPLEQWKATIPQTTAAINEAFETIQTRGLDSLSQGIADVITGTKSLGAVFKDITRSIIADIIQMTVRMLVFRAISGLFGGAAGGGAGGSVAPSGITGPRAKGGPVSPGGTYLVGEQGPELFRPSTPGSIVPNHKMAANSNGPIEIMVGFGPAPEFAPYVMQVSAAHAQEAVRVSTQHTNEVMKGAMRPRLNQGRG